MNFDEFEKIMSKLGATTLAEIARFHDATPQAVSNWKARDQVPYHVVAKIQNKSINNDVNTNTLIIDHSLSLIHI